MWSYCNIPIVLLHDPIFTYVIAAWIIVTMLKSSLRDKVTPIIYISNNEVYSYTLCVLLDAFEQLWVL